TQLYVSNGVDSNRVMIFNVATGTIANGENAADLLGQYTSLSSTATVNWAKGGANNGASGLGFDSTSGLDIDPVHHLLFVGDTEDGTGGRVLVYTLNADNSIPTAAGGHTASYALGQPDLVSEGAVTSQAGLNTVMGLAADSANQRLFVTDYWA